MMYSPSAMSLARSMGDHFRYKSAIGTSLSELAILMTARSWSQDYEWSVHYPAALKAGISPPIADAIGRAVRPDDLSPDQAMVYDFVNELLTQQQVSDGQFERVKRRFGEAGVVDLTGIVGYYTLLAMQLNVARYPAPAGAARLPPAAR